MYIMASSPKSDVSVIALYLTVHPLSVYSRMPVESERITKQDKIMLHPIRLLVTYVCSS